MPPGMLDPQAMMMLMNARMMNPRLMTPDRQRLLGPPAAPSPPMAAKEEVARSWTLVNKQHTQVTRPGRSFAEYLTTLEHVIP